MKKTVFKLLLFAMLVLLVSCTDSEPKNTDVPEAKEIQLERQEVKPENTMAQSEKTYKTVPPTEEELNLLSQKLDVILGTHFRDYDCNSENAYQNIFNVNHLRAVVPEYDDEIEKYIAPPLDYYESGSNAVPEWWVSEEQNDPLGKFPEIFEEIYDENGNVSEDAAFELLKKYRWNEIVVGTNRYSASYIDWIVEGVWNGKTDHATLMNFDDYTCLYYHDGFYYTPEYVGDYGDDGYVAPVIENIVPLDDCKYEINYHFDSFDAEPNNCKAVVGLKETPDGFRFWSIYSIDYNAE